MKLFLCLTLFALVSAAPVVVPPYDDHEIILDDEFEHLDRKEEMPSTIQEPKLQLDTPIHTGRKTFTPPPSDEPETPSPSPSPEDEFHGLERWSAAPFRWGW